MSRYDGLCCGESSVLLRSIGLMESARILFKLSATEQDRDAFRVFSVLGVSASSAFHIGHHEKYAGHAEDWRQARNLIVLRCAPRYPKPSCLVPPIASN